MKKIIIVLILLAILPFTRVFAQTGEIIYRDFEPDSILVYWLYLGPIYIDLDVDGEPSEFVMQMYESGYICYPDLNTIGDNIRICAIEDENTDIVLSEVEEEKWVWNIGWWGGPLANYYSHYGFRIKRGDDYYYGWFETYNRYVGKVEGKQIAHYGFDRTAYCTIPNYPLRWGQTELSDDVSENGALDFANIVPNPTTGVFTVTGENLNQIEVIDVLGQRITSLTANSDQTTIDLSGQPAGVYLVNVTDQNGKHFIKKIIKQN